jgi:hypothetical protein
MGQKADAASYRRRASIAQATDEGKDDFAMTYAVSHGKNPS